MEDTLVAALSKRSAVSVGDTLLVDGLDQTFELKVQQLLPAAQVSVIGELPMSALPMTPSSSCFSDYGLSDKDGTHNSQATHAATICCLFSSHRNTVAWRQGAVQQLADA